MGILISAAGSGDIEAIVALVNGAYRGESGGRGWTSEAELIGGQRTDAHMIAEDLAKGTILTAKDADRLVGCVYLETFRPGGLYFGMLTIDPDHQSRGLGSRLLDEVEAYAAKHGCSRIEFWVYAYRESLIAWYERRGYTATGETLASTGDDKYGVPKREGLHLERRGRDL